MGSRSSGWSNWVSGDAASRRAGGRRRYNAMRQRKAWERRMELAETFDLVALVMGRGVKFRAAEYLGVSPATITRDVRAIFRWTNKRQEDLAWKLERKLMKIKIRQAVKEAKARENRNRDNLEEPRTKKESKNRTDLAKPRPCLKR